MVIDESLLEEYPFSGSFYKKTVDDSLPLDERVEEETIVLETPCDIQESSKNFSAGNITATYSIYFPFNKDEALEVSRGMCFKGDFYGLKVDGEVIGLYPSQIGGCVAYIKDFDV